VFAEQDAKEDIFGLNGTKYSKMPKNAQYGASSLNIIRAIKLGG